MYVSSGFTVIQDNVKKVLFFRRYYIHSKSVNFIIRDPRMADELGKKGTSTTNIAIYDKKTSDYI